MNCPKCGETLKRVEQPSEGPYSMLNADQWRSTIPGDLFCTCHNNNRGDKPYAYFWKNEVGHKGSATAQTPTQKALSQACEEAANQIGTAIKVGGYIDIAAVADLIYKYMRDLLHGEAAPPATETQPDELLSTLDEITEALNTVSASAVLAGEGHDGRDAHNIYKIVCRTTNKVMWVRGILAKEPPCKDCNAAARIAYSDATTPGFFSAKCPKHRAGATETQPSYEWQCMNCSFVTRDEQRAADHQTTMTPLHAYRRITLGATETAPDKKNL